MRTRVLFSKFKARLRGGIVAGSSEDESPSSERVELKEFKGKLVRKNKRIEKLQERVAKKDQELAALRGELAGARYAQPLPNLLDRDTQVFFLVGRPRSGTTWLRGILNHHREIMCWGEGRFLEQDFEWKDFEQSLLTNIPPYSLYGAFLRSRHLRTWIDRSVWTKGRGTEEHLVNLTRLAIDYFLAEQLSKTKKRIVGDKTPFASAGVFEEIGAVYPEAKVMHIIRDGRDVAVSMMHHMWSFAKHEGGIFELEPEEVEKRDAYRKGSLSSPDKGLFTKERLTDLAAGWSAEISRAIEDGPALLKDNYAEVRYEDILERPLEEIQRLLEFLGAEASKTTAERLVERSSFERNASRKRGEEDSSSRFRKGLAGDWKNVFTEEDKRIFKEVAGELLIRLGYEKDSNW